MPEQSQIHSTGRGGEIRTGVVTFIPFSNAWAGAGKIGKDTTTYVDGDIVKEGVAGEPTHAGAGEYSAGRGGAGNMVPSPKVGPTSGGPVQQGADDVIPEPAMRAGEQYADFHTGRGGQGNVHRDKYGGHSKPQHEKKEGLLDKAKHAIGLDKKKEDKSDPTK